MIDINRQLSSWFSEHGPEKTFLTRKLFQSSKHAAVHYHVKDFWTNDVTIDRDTLVVKYHQLQWVTVKSSCLNFDDELLIGLWFWSLSNSL